MLLFLLFASLCFCISTQSIGTPESINRKIDSQFGYGRNERITEQQKRGRLETMSSKKVESQSRKGEEGSHNQSEEMRKQSLVNFSILRDKQIRKNTEQLMYPYCKQEFKKQIFPNLFHPNSLALQDRQMLVDTIYGFRLYVDALDATLSKTIANTGTWQPQMIQLIATLIKQSDHILNVGSHVGLEAIIMGKIIGQNGQLFVVQPYSFSYQLLQKNIDLNKLRSITQLDRVGASDKTGKGIIEVKFSNTGSSQIKEIDQDAKNNGNYLKINKLNHMTKYRQQVQLMKIDQLIPKDISLDFALIDVQKMEVKVLNGMRDVIQRSPNLLMVVEWQYGLNKNARRQETEELLDFLLGRGYRIFRYIGSGKNENGCRKGRFVELLKKETLFRISFLDLFFIPNSKIPS